MLFYVNLLSAICGVAVALCGGPRPRVDDCFDYKAMNATYVNVAQECASRVNQNDEVISENCSDEYYKCVKDSFGNYKSDDEIDNNKFKTFLSQWASAKINETIDGDLDGCADKQKQAAEKKVETYIDCVKAVYEQKCDDFSDKLDSFVTLLTNSETRACQS